MVELRLQVAEVRGYGRPLSFMVGGDGCPVHSTGHEPTDVLFETAPFVNVGSGSPRQEVETFPSHAVSRAWASEMGAIS